MTTYDWDAMMQNAAGAFEPVPDGDYDVTVVKSEDTITSTDKDMIKVVFEIENGPHAGRKVWHQFVFTPDNPTALSFFFQHMRALGLSREWFSQNKPSFDQISDTLLNRRCRITTSTREFNGQDRNDVRSVKPALGNNGPGSTPASQAPAPSTQGAPVPPPVAQPSQASGPAVPPPPGTPGSTQEGPSF